MAAITSEHIISIEDLRPDVSHLITEDDTPVDNLFSEKQQRLLTEPLYTSWQPRRKDAPNNIQQDETQQDEPKGESKSELNTVPRLFLAMANVGLYYGVRQDPIVPDVMVSLDVQAPADWWEKYNRCYMVWEFGKVPEIVLEIVSNLQGEELGKKLHRYEQIGVPYYAVFDPAGHYGGQRLRLFHRNGSVLQEVERIDPNAFPLALTVWEGEYEGATAEWLRWADHDGNLILTGSERVKEEQQRVKEAQQRVKEEQQRANEAEQRMNDAQQQVESAESALAQERLANERLAAKLRELGINPETL
jgi:Uma2 family endonuclease